MFGKVRFPNRKIEDAVRLGSHRCAQKPRWFIQRFVAQLKRPPVHRDKVLRAQLTKRDHGLLWIDVLRAHKPARCIGADR